MRLIVASILVCLLASSAWAGNVEFSGQFAFRSEWFDTPSASSEKAAAYGLGHARLRGFADYARDRWHLSVGAQAAASLGLPESGAFGIGPVYYGANKVTTPGRISLLRFLGEYRGKNLTVGGGRMKYADGAESRTGVRYLDGVKKRRINERLLGNWDWVNVGRRYDGGKFLWNSENVWLHGFYFVPLQGGVNYKEAHEWVEDLAVFGGSAGLPYGSLVPKTEVRAAAYQYVDDRSVAIGPSGDNISLTTVTGHAIWGDEYSDAWAWLAYQFGDWQDMNQKALGFIAEAGHRFAGSRGTPGLRVGVAQASGQDNSGDRTTFFNMLPTNHKFYGAMDYNAFSNLRDVYLIGKLSPCREMTLRAAGHVFSLVEPGDAWYGGSGAFNEAKLGYARRPVPEGGFKSSDLGRELDVEVTWKPGDDHKLMGGVGFWWGGDAAREIQTQALDGFWGYVMMTQTIR